MSEKTSNSECPKQLGMDDRRWGSYSESEYSTSGYSNLSSSPMQCSGKLDDTSSLCSSNGSSNVDAIKLPKPPASLGRRQTRQSFNHEIFELNDLILEPIPVQPEEYNTTHINVPNVALLTKDDRYEALRNIDIIDNARFSFQESQQMTVPATNPFIENIPVSFSSTSFLHQHQNKNEISPQGTDKYAAISEAINILRDNQEDTCKNMNLTQSMSSNIEHGWSSQILNGESFQ